MTATRTPIEADAITQANRLLRLGYVSYSEGSRKQAYRFWRRAAMLNPGDEQIWLALLTVLETPEDRRVCLQNILALNPNNLQARQQLRALEAVVQPAAAEPAQAGAPPHPLARLALRLVEIGLLSGLLVIGITAGRFLWLRAGGL